MSSSAQRRYLANALTSAPKRFGKLLKSSVGLLDASDGPEDAHWNVGGRYPVLQPLELRARPDQASDICGRIKPKDSVLLLALQSFPEDADPNQPQVLLAYLANTKKPDWVNGWGVIGGSNLPVPVLRRRRLKGSWEVGGRYVVNGIPILRTGIELESEQLCEVRAREEVLVLDLGLVIRSGEPRLRARVRTDAGDLGWLTIELPGGEPLLEPLNLYSEEAISRRNSLFGSVSGSSRRNSNVSRVTLDGVQECGNEAYSPGGKYRLLTSTVVNEDSDIRSRILGELRKGTLLYVNDVRIVPRESGAMVTRMLVSSENVNAVGWVSATDVNGQKIVDSRDHLEYDKLIRSLAVEEPPVVAPQLSERSAQTTDRAPTPQEENAHLPDPPHVNKQDEEDRWPGPLSQRAEEQNAQVHPQAYGSEQARDEWGGSEAHHKNEPALPPQRSPQQDPYLMKRPWGSGNVGYRRMEELEEGAEDDRDYSEEIDKENGTNICCHSGFLSCGGLTSRRQKAKTNGTAVNGFMSSMGMLGEPAPEPRPMRQLPSPPAYHATAHPQYH